MARAPFGDCFTLPLVAGFLVMLTPSGFREDAGLLNLPVEPLEQALKVFLFSSYNLCQLTSASF